MFVYWIRFCPFPFCSRTDLDISSCTSRFFLSNEQKLCSSYQKRILVISSVSINEHNSINSDHYINVLQDHKPLHSCFRARGKIFSILYPAQIQLPKFQKLPKLVFKKLSVADMSTVLSLNCSSSFLCLCSLYSTIVPFISSTKPKHF